MRNLYILVGVSGAGKSTEAKRLARLHGVIRESVTICSADDFFTRTGSYLFDPKQLGEAHASCMRDATEACVRGDDCVIIDNTNLTNVERAPYYLLGVAFGYTIHVVWVTDVPKPSVLAERNTHGVSEETIMRMIYRMEPLPPFWTVTHHHAKPV